MTLIRTEKRSVNGGTETLYFYEELPDLRSAPITAHSPGYAVTYSVR